GFPAEAVAEAISAATVSTMATWLSLRNDMYCPFRCGSESSRPSPAIQFGCGRWSLSKHFGVARRLLDVVQTVIVTISTSSTPEGGTTPERGRCLPGDRCLPPGARRSQ